MVVSPGVRRAGDALGQLAVAAVWMESCQEGVGQACNIATVEQVLRYGAEMVGSTSLSRRTSRDVSLGDTAEARILGRPLAEMIGRCLEHHYGRQEAPETNLSDPIAVVARMGAEYGGDLIKTIYTGDKAEFTSVVCTTTVPILVAGGPKTGSDAEFLSMVRDCMDAGAAGVTMGRNIWQRPCLEGMIAALCAIVHDDATAEEALKLL
jgi:DhnA family fructose-bisphosphate aldolase class Ia